MNDYRPLNILELLQLIGEEETARILSDFSCPLNPEIEHFARTNAIDFAKRKLSVTYLVLDENGRLAALFTLTHKAVQVFHRALSQSMRKKLQRYAQLDEMTDSYLLSAFLIAQFGKNYRFPREDSISGNLLMDMAMCVLKAVQTNIGGGIVYLECEDHPKLLQFYQNEANHFHVFGERYSAKDQVRYVQLMKTF